MTDWSNELNWSSLVNSGSFENVVGTMVWWNDNKGYGFARVPGSKKDCFIHYTTIVSDSGYKSLLEFETVGLSGTLTNRGVQAIKTIPLKSKVSG